MCVCMPYVCLTLFYVCMFGACAFVRLMVCLRVQKLIVCAYADQMFVCLFAVRQGCVYVDGSN